MGQIRLSEKSELCAGKISGKEFETFRQTRENLAASNKLINCPDHFRCPISGLIMIDPVIASSGATFERRNILAWREAGFEKCPKTHLGFTNGTLQPDNTLKVDISQWYEQHCREQAETEEPQDTKDESIQLTGLSEQTFMDIKETMRKSPYLKLELASCPKQFCCPISGLIMIDPVTVPSGVTYDRQCIEAWIEAGFLWCPCTKKTISSTDLIPNIAVRELISAWCQGQKM